MARDIAESPNPAGADLTLARQHRTRRALWFMLIPVVAMVVFSVISFNGDWTYPALAGAMILVVLGMLYLEGRRTERLLPLRYWRLLTEVVERDGTCVPPSEEAPTAMARLARLQAEMDALARVTPEMQSLNPRLGVWAAVSGAALWLIAAVAALFVHDFRGAFVCVVMSAFFGGLAWFTHEERKRRQDAIAMMARRMSQEGSGRGAEGWRRREP
jgi:hypothetical protein